MTFLECILSAAETGKITPKKAGEAEQAYIDAVATTKAEGLTDAQAEMTAAHRAVEAVGNYTEAKKWERINELQKAYALDQRFKGMTAPTRAWSALDQLMDEVYLSYRAVSGQLFANLNVVLEAFEPKLAGIIKPVENMADVIRELYGQGTGNAAAREMAEAVANSLEQMRKMLNLEGASVPENKNFRFPQTHERHKVRQATQAVWVQDHLAEGVLDWEVIQYHGKAVPVDKRQEVLEKVWETITTEGRNKIDPAHPANETLASRLSRSRFLFYKTGDAWLEMQEKYGSGDFFHQLVEQIDSTARNISLMRHFGPSIATGKEFAQRLFDSNLGDLMTAATPDRANRLEYLGANAVDRFKSQYALHSRDVNPGAGDPAVAAIGTARTLVGTAMLGAAVTNSWGDAFIGMWVRHINKMPWISTIPKYFSAVANFKHVKQEMIDNGIIYESAISMAYEGQRYNLALEGSGYARRISEINYRIQGAAAMNQIGRAVAGMDLAKALARGRELSFDDLPFAATMQNLGITAEDWDLVRGTELYQPVYYNFGRAQLLRPIDMYGAATNQAQRKAANKFLMLQEMFARDLSPAPTIRSRTAVGEAVSPAGWAGQMLRTATQLTLFPATLMFNHWRMIAAAPRWTERAYRMGTFFLFTTAGGALIAQTKDLLSGKELAPMVGDGSWEFWKRAMVLGGGGAIIGDFIYENFLSANGALGASTPLGQEWQNLRNAVNKAQDDIPGNATKEMIDFAWGLTPKPVPFKLAMERMVLDPLIEMTDPEAYHRKINYQQEDDELKNQERWWGTGD